MKNSKNKKLDFKNKNNFLLWILVVIVLVAAMNMFFSRPNIEQYDIGVFQEKLYAGKIKKEKLLIDWTEDAMLIHNKIRAFSPYPCMHTFLENKRIKIHCTKPLFLVDEKSLNVGEFYVYKNQIIV